MKTLALFTIFVLIFGTASTSLVSDAYAQNDLNILLRIAEQADKQIKNQLDRSYGNSIPSDIKDLHDQGHKAVESLKKSLPDDVEQARENFLIAMKSFKQISKMISEPIEKATISKSTRVADRDLSSELDRLEKYVENLKTISKKHNTGITFDEIDTLIESARTQIETETASEIIDQLKHHVNSIQQKIRDSSSDSTSDRIKQFVEKQLKTINKKLTKASDAGATADQIGEAVTLIDQIESSIENNDIGNAKLVFYELNKLVKNIERSVR
jgi:Zn-dependent M32 family carboxypeptidase